MFFISLAAVLLLLCTACLIRGPEETRIPEPEERRVCALLSSDRGTAGVEQADDEEGRRGPLTAEAIPQTAPVTATGDRNGLPLGSRTWVRTAYASCPPEGNFG